MATCKYCNISVDRGGGQICPRCDKLSKAIAVTPNWLLSKIIHAERNDLFVIQSGRKKIWKT